MKVLFFVNDDGPESRAAIELSEAIKIDVNDIGLYHWDDEETTSLASLYDIYALPAVLITKDDGGYVELWQGQLPTASELIYRAKNG